MANYDELMSAPDGDTVAEVETVNRAEAVYTCDDAQFKLETKNYERQFAQLYYYRLMDLRPSVSKRAKALWPDVPFVNVLGIPEEGEVAVIGTIYKEMALKPSILDEYDKDRALKNQLGRTHFTQPDDRLVLEDDGARVSLSGDIFQAKDCVTGIVAAVRGSVQPNGDFEVSAVSYAGLAPQPPLPSTEEDKYVVLVSGFGVGEDANSCLQLQLLVDYICGCLGAAQERSLAASIVRVVIAGGLLKSSSALSQPTTYNNSKQQAAALDPIRHVDMALTELAASVPVDVMPGASDPANYSLPQQPLHRCLFPGAATYSTLNRCTNPHQFELDGVSFLGTAGQNVDDIARYSDIEDRVKILESFLQWRHLIPTAPDTLAAYPYYDKDPFIMKAAPHVLFAGCQPAYGSAMVRGEEGQTVRVVAVPEFTSTGCAVLVNLRTLETQPLYFESQLGKKMDTT